MKIGSVLKKSSNKVNIDREIRVAYQIFLQVYNNITITNGFVGEDFSGEAFMKTICGLQKFSESDLCYFSVRVIRHKLIDIHRCKKKRPEVPLEGDRTLYKKHVDDINRLCELGTDTSASPIWGDNILVEKISRLKEILGDQYDRMIHLEDTIKTKQETLEYRRIVYAAKKKIDAKASSEKLRKQR